MSKTIEYWVWVDGGLTKHDMPQQAIDALCERLTEGWDGEENISGSIDVIEIEEDDEDNG